MARRAPRGFVYAVKAGRYLAHMKKLKGPADPLRRFFTRAKRLARTFGPVLYQLLPPRWPLNLGRHGVALCVHDRPGSASGKRAVGPFTDVRFHGTQKYGADAPRDAARLRDRIRRHAAA